MKHAFTYKDDKSSKFWWIDYSGKDYVVNYGKMGTNGKYEIKEFSDPEECEKQALKLMGQKVKKGYTPCLDYDFSQRNYFDDEEIGLHPKTSHPNFTKHFTADFYYDCADEEAPFGNDNGADTLSELQDHIKKNGNTDVTVFPRRLIEKNWDMTYVPPINLDEDNILKLVPGDKTGELAYEDLIYLNNQVMIAAAFGQIKITGVIQDRLRELAIQSLKRMAVLRKHENYPPSAMAEKMLTDLETFQNNKAPEPSEECAAIIRYLDCPCQVFSKLLDDDDMIFAYECALREGKEKGYTPLLVIISETLLEQITMEVDDDSDMDFDLEKVKDYQKSVIEKAASLNAEQLLREKKDECFEDEGIEIGKVSGGERMDSFTGYWNYDSRLTQEVILAKIPTDKPWEVAAWVPMGGFNDCPNSAEQVAVMKRWNEKFSAIPAVVSYDTWEFAVEQAIENKEQALALALEHYGFCYDRIADDHTIGRLASTLMRSNKWYFWWD